MIEDFAVLLRRTAWSESSLIVQLLTRTHGRIALLARGARRAKSPFRGQLEPLHRLRVAWHPGRAGMGTLRRCEREQALLPPQRWPEGLALLPLVAKLFPEGTDAGYQETTQALACVAKAEAHAWLAGIWRLLLEAGLAAPADRCWRCGAQRAELFLNPQGLRCRDCGGGAPWPLQARQALEGKSASSQARGAAEALVRSVLAMHEIRIPWFEEAEARPCTWA